MFSEERSYIQGSIVTVMLVYSSLALLTESFITVGFVYMGVEKVKGSIWRIFPFSFNSADIE